MINETMIMNHLRMTIGDILIDAFPTKWYLDIINNVTLYEWSEFFPYLIRGITIKARDGIPTRHPQTNMLISSFKYKIPKETEDIEYLNIEEFLYPGNIIQNQVSSNLPALNGLANMIKGSLPNAQYFNIVRYSAFFAPPDILTITPPPMNHLDFSLVMQRKVQIYEVPMYYRRYFLELCELDVKLALHAKFKNLKDGASYQGVEINTSFISELGDAKNEKKELFDLFRKNAFLDPTRFSGNLQVTG